MGMQIEEHLHFISVSLNVFLQGPNNRIPQFVWICPCSIGICSIELCSTISMNYSVCVHHRNYFEHKSVQEIIGNVCLGKQEVEYSFHHETGSGLTWMLSGNDPYNSFSVFYIPVTYLQNVKFLAT